MTQCRAGVAWRDCPVAEFPPRCAETVGCRPAGESLRRPGQVQVGGVRRAVHADRSRGPSHGGRPAPGTWSGEGAVVCRAGAAAVPGHGAQNRLRVADRQRCRGAGPPVVFDAVSRQGEPPRGAETDGVNT